MQFRSARITGTGMYVPERVVTNNDLTELMDTSDEWIRKRTGIEERHYVDEGVGPIDLAEIASKRAIEAAGLKPEDIDAIIVPSLSPHHFFPGISAFLQDRLGISNGSPAMDVRCQCTGFLYALEIAHLYVASGKYDRVLVCGAEVHSTGVNRTTEGRDVAVIFGDGAGAIIVEPSDETERGILSVHTHAEGKFAKKLWVDAPGCVYDGIITPDMLDEGRHFPVMEGKFVFKHAVTRMPEVIHEALDTNKCSVDDVDLFLFHQANLRINEFVGHSLGIPPEKTYNNIQKYGNCSAASIPILIDECVRSGRITDGTLVGLAGFGSGFTWGSSLIRW